MRTFHCRYLDVQQWKLSHRKRALAPATCKGQLQILLALVQKLTVLCNLGEAFQSVLPLRHLQHLLLKSFCRIVAELQTLQGVFKHHPACRFYIWRDMCLMSPLPHCELRPLTLWEAKSLKAERWKPSGANQWECSRHFAPAGARKPKNKRRAHGEIWVMSTSCLSKAPRG